MKGTAQCQLYAERGMLHQSVANWRKTQILKCWQGYGVIGTVIVGGEVNFPTITLGKCLSFSYKSKCTPAQKFHA